MTQAGIPVPPGFVVLASTFDRFIDETGLTTKIEAILQATDTNKSGEVEKSSEKIQTLILSKETPQDIKQDILQNFKKLNAKFVAVRSSATSEDSASAAWAGQLDSFLNTTEKSLLDNVKRCWASLFTPRAIFYRFEQKLNKDKISVAVVVQKMVNSEKSGIAFSVHPVTQKENQIIIEAGFGLGEAIVSGSVTPDSYVIDKNNLQILDINVSEQTRALYKKPVGGSEWQELGTLGATQALAEKQILELAQLIIQIEKHYGFPCDIEWAFENNKFYIVQSRPITTLDNNKTKDKKNNFLDKEWTKIWTTEYTMFSIWLFGREYTESCKKVLDFGFDDIIFLVEGNLATVYRDNKRQEEFVKFLAEKSLLDVGFKDKCLKMCQKLNDKLLQYINLEEAEALKYDNFSNFIEIHQQFIAYFLVALWSPNGFPAINVSEKMKNKVFKEYEYARKLTEHTYPDIEKYIKKLYLYISKKEKIDAKLLGAMLPEELLAYIKFGKLPAASVLKQRYDYAVVLSDAKENKLVLGEEAKAIVEKISGIDTKGMKEISGSIANKGNIVGRVRKIFMAKDMSNFKSGEILVTTMTRPEWLPIMKMAAGFITDAGGVLSHAAIVSRELNKPCIIGTKIATQVLKDGDLVEVDADNGVVRILEGEQNQKEKSLYEKYMESLQGNESFTFSGPFSNLFTAFPWGNDKYYSKYYKTPPFSFLYIGKGREATETFDNTKYKLYAKEIFQNFIEHKITLESLENNFNTLTKKAEIIYKKKIDDSIKTFKEALDLLMHLIAATLYVELFDKNIVEEILKNKINDLDWEKATHPQFESFKSRWDQKIKKAKTLEEVQYIFTDYFFIKDLDYIKKEVENIKSKKIEKEQSKQVKTLNADWAKYTQLVMKIRDFRKDSIQMLSVVMARCAQALYPTAKIDEITNLNGLEVINENLPTIDELRKRQSGYVMLIRPDLTYEISYEQYEEAKKQISSASILGNELRGTVARKGKVTGKVKIILDSESNKDFKVGEILVTSMTRPEFVFLMKKSAAIITNEGGISCHAAIISRELNIPCIIGTKIATQVLKDGDLVEVDADNGVVRILENNIEGCLDFFEKYLDKYKFQVEGGRAAFYLLNYFLVNQYTVENKEWPLNEINVISNSLDHKAKWIRIHKDQLEYEKILIKFIKNPELTGLLYKYLKKNSDFAIKTLKNKNFKNVSNNELLDFFGVVCDCYYKILRPSVIIRLVDLGLINRFEKIFANKKDVENYAAIVSINKKLSSALSEKIEMLSLATKISKTKSINSKYISSGLSKIIEKYCFSELGYYNEKVKTKEDYFIKLLDFSKNNPKLQLKKIKDEQKEALKKYSELLKKLNNKDKVAVGIASELAYIKDQYKLLMNKALYFSEPLFLEIAKRTNKTVNYIKDLSPDEIKDLLDRKDVDEEFITKRANNHVLVTFKKKLYVLTDGDADKFRLAYLENDKAKRELFGRTVFPGHILGTVKVILEQKDFAKMKEGDILVVMTTSPDFTLIMKKAKAIVAEEGGLTSHTAIVSREMKIPAIVGVHHATAILHDGDLVEVDADNGVVRILESKDGNELNTTINNKEAGAQGENKKTNYAHHKIVMNLFHSCGFMKAFQKKYESRFLLTEVTVKWVKFHPELSESILDQNGDGGEFLLKKIISGEVKFRDFFYNKSLEVIKLAEKLDKLSYDNLKFGKKIVLDQFYQSYTDVISMMYAIGYVLDPVFDTYIAENKIILKNSEHI
ncbi:MAG: PEP/pyruvate-binding domain-containing protein, partial [Patescibacteria group bacterium]